MIFSGSGVAICTPFNCDNEFDPEVYARMIEFHAEKGTDAIISCGTTGEASTLSYDEHTEVVRTAVIAAKAAGEKRGRKLTVVAGSGGNDTTACINLGRRLVNAGADALMYVTPYYNKTSQRGLIAHYSALESNLDLPIMVYNVPTRTTVNVQAKTMAVIAKLPGIAAVKEASGDISQIAEVAERCEGLIDLYSGNDDQILPVLALGGVGVVSTVANIAPSRVRDIITSFALGDVEAARKNQLALLPLIRLVFKDINPIPVKAGVRLLGFDAGECRLPLTNLDEGLEIELRDEMIRLGLIK